MERRLERARLTAEDGVHGHEVGADREGDHGEGEGQEGYNYIPISFVQSVDHSRMT